MTDTLLTRTYAATRSPEAFATLITHYQRMVFATCRRKLHNAADLDDAVQETFLRLAQNAHALHTNVGAWLHRAAVNVSRDMNRRRTAQRRHETDAATHQPAAHDDASQQQLTDLREHLDAALNKLKPAQRELLVQRYFVGRAQTELAAELHIAPSTLSHRLDVAVEALRRQLGGGGGGAVVGAAAVAAVLEAESASAAVPAALTANLMKIGLTGVPGKAAAVGVPVLLKILAGVAALLLIATVTWWLAGGLHSAVTPVVGAPAGTAAPDAGMTVRATTQPEVVAAPKWKSAPIRADAPVAGHVLDPAGRPIGNATVTFNGPGTFSATTDDDGVYTVDDLPHDGLYRVSVQADGFLPIEGYAAASPQIQLTAQSQARRDFVMQRGATLEVTVQNAALEPLRNADVYVDVPGNNRLGQYRRTDKLGHARFTLAPSATPYVVAARADNLALDHRTVLVNSSDKSAAASLSLRPGVTIQGTAICADGKPATGWKIIAQPDWWLSLYQCPLSPIDTNGNFTLQNITPDTYLLSVSKPYGDGSLSEPLRSVALPPAAQPLRVDISGPSPTTFADFIGRIHFNGATTDYVNVSADSLSGDHQDYRANVTMGPSRNRTLRLKADEAQFRFPSIPPGTYRIEFDSSTIEPKVLERVQIPGALPVVELNVVGKSHLAGTVLDAATHQPITHFAVRVAKTRSIGPGPNYGQGPNWTQVSDPDGHFSIDLVGPGVYRAQISTESYAWLWSPKVAIDQLGKSANITLNLTPGGSLAGVVTDPAGKPVANAKVIPLSMAQSTAFDFGPKRFGSEAGAVATDAAGHFLLPHLAPGDETIQIVHPDFAPAIVQHLTIAEQRTANAGTIALHVGGTVEGTVFDGQGHPMPGMALDFQDASGYSGGDERFGRVASAVTDTAGHYQVPHLAEQIVYINRRDRSTGEAVGTVRRTVLPRDGRTARLDFGGTTPLTGRLLLNGQPLSNHNVQLSDESAYFGPVMANASTDSDGHFTFFGPPAGEYILLATLEHGSEPFRVRSVDVPADRALDLGTLSIDAGNVLIAVTASDPVAPAVTWMSIEEDQPREGWHQDIAQPGAVPGHADQWLAQYVSVGHFRCVVYCGDALSLIIPFERRAGAPQTMVACTLPARNATLTVGPSPKIGGYPRELLLRCDDKRVVADMRLDPDKPTTVHLPAGVYHVADPRSTKIDPGMAPITLHPGDSQTIDWAHFPLWTKFTLVMLRVWTADGVLVTDATPQLLDSAGHAVAPNGSGGLGPQFSVDPGRYRAVVERLGATIASREINVPAPSTESQRPGQMGLPVDLFLP